MQNIPNPSTAGTSSSFEIQTEDASSTVLEQLTSGITVTLTCNSPCATCPAGEPNKCSTCQSGQFLQENTCKAQCDSDFYADAGSTCSPCNSSDANCNKCNSPPMG